MSLYFVILSFLLAVASADPAIEAMVKSIGASVQDQLTLAPAEESLTLESLTSGEQIKEQMKQLVEGSSDSLTVEVGFFGLLVVRAGLRGQKTVNVNLTVLLGGGAGLSVTAENSSQLAESDKEVHQIVDRVYEEYITNKSKILAAEADALVGQFARVKVQAKARKESSRVVINGGYVKAAKTKLDVDGIKIK